ncbi:cytochrome P450 [Mycena latifolia]|nr:cytochrome P450 [Mycena latifolia]
MGFPSIENRCPCSRVRSGQYISSAKATMDQIDRANFHVLGLAIVAASAIILLRLMLRRLLNSNIVATVPGPPSPSWIYGNMIQLVLAENYGDYEFGWQKQYGHVYRVKGCFGEDRLVVSDPQALKYILNNPAIAHSPNNAKTFPLVFGENSVASVHGEEHRRLRAAMSAGFSGRGARTFLPVFVDVAKKIIWEWENTCSPGSSSRLNVGKMLDHATLDIICDAALGLPVNSVQNPDHPFARSHLEILASAFIRSKANLIAEWFMAYTPEFVFRLALRLPLRPLSAVHSFKGTTKKLMEEKSRDFGSDVGEKSDLLSVIRAGSGFGKTGVTTSQLVHQLPVLLLAGQDTSAAALSWAFYWLAQHPGFQDNLRQEILSANLNSREGELDYDNLPLLNALLKETLRMFPPAPILERSANEDCVLPLSSEIVTSTGKRIHELPVRKGQFIFLALGAYQRVEALWGPDADKFKPSRWLDGDPCKGQTSALGPYAQLLTFLGGHRVCAGWRFALLEMQVILVELVGKFSFALPKDSVVRVHFSATQFPVDGEGAKGLWLSVERLAN